jgi:hypothetical protein
VRRRLATVSERRASAASATGMVRSSHDRLTSACSFG